MVNLDSSQSLFQFMKTIANERNRAGHLAVDSSSIQTDTNVIVLHGFFCKSPNVFGLTSACHSVHNKDNRFLCVRICLSEPVKRDVASIRKEHSLPFKRNFNLRRVKVINGLKIVTFEVRGREIKGFFLWELSGEERPKAPGYFLNNHSGYS
jgi:hypothetical protein